MSNDTLGLVPPEIDWLRVHMHKDDAARDLVTWYRMVCDCPGDPGARMVFAEKLKTWRAAPDYPFCRAA